jgi:hypothetical protein
MSSGTKGNANFLVPFHGKTESYRSWSGTDGKYESYGGSLRPKWNSYSSEQCSQMVTQGSIQWTCTQPGGGTDTTLNWFGHERSYRPYSDGYWPSITNNEVLRIQNNLLQKVKGHSFDLGVNLAQMGQVTRMASSNLGKLGRSFLALRHGDFSAAARELGAAPRVSRLRPPDISGRWLELQYGWMPLLSDTYEAAKAFEAISKGPRTARFRSSKVTKSMEAFYATGDDSWSRLHKRTLQYSFELYEEMGFARQLGMLDPLSVAWELIPYSFVVDWFVPLGTYLDNLNQIPKLNGRWLVHSGYETSGAVKYKRNSPYPPCGYHGGAHRYQVQSRTPAATGSYRWVSRGAPDSSPSVPKPGFNRADAAIHGNRLWNAIALASQRFFGSYLPGGRYVS